MHSSRWIYCIAESRAPPYDSGMSKMGRPSKSKHEQKKHLITLRLTADEVKTIDAAAKRDGKNRSEWARNALTSYVLRGTNNGE
jgi:hypothetical protein